MAQETLDKIRRAFIDCIVQEFENDERCEEILRRLEGRINECVLAKVQQMETELRVVEQSRDFWYRHYKYERGQR